MHRPLLNIEQDRKWLSEVSIVDALYYSYLFCVVLMSTLGYSSEDSVYKIVVAIGAVFAFIRIMSLQYNSKYLAISLGLVILGCFALMVSGRFTLLLTVLLLVAAKDLRTHNLLKTFFIAKIVGLVLLGLFVATGLFKIEVYQYYKIVSSSYVERMTINGSGTTVLHLSLITCISLWFYLRSGKVSAIYYVLCFFANAAFYSISRSTMGLLMGFASPVLFLLISTSDRRCRAFIKLSKLALPAMLLFSFGTAKLYGENTFVNWLDKLFQGRIYYNNYFLNEYPFSLFGHGMLSSEGNFDNSFVFIWIAYGAVTFVVIFSAMQKAIQERANKGDWVAIAVIVIFLLVALSESFYPSAAVNPSLFMLVSLFESLEPKGYAGKKIVHNKSKTVRRQ